MNKNHKWEDETDRLRNSFFTEGFHCLVYNVSEAYNLVKAHKHDFPQFVIMQSGATRQTQSSRAYHLGSGDILFTPPGVMHSMSLAEQKYFYNFSVTTEIARAALTAACGEECGFADITPLITPREKDMALILNQIMSLEATLDGIEICDEDDAFYKDVVYHQVFAILYLIFSVAGKEKANTALAVREDERTRNTDSPINYLDNHYYEEIRFADVAERFGMSQATMSRRFFAARGVKLQDYLNRRRVSEAQKLMAQENMSLFYIADAVGYQDFSTFYRNFKRCCGMSPSQYREIVLGQAKADISNEKTEDKTE